MKADQQTPRAFTWLGLGLAPVLWSFLVTGWSLAGFWTDFVALAALALSSLAVLSRGRVRGWVRGAWVLVALGSVLPSGMMLLCLVTLPGMLWVGQVQAGQVVASCRPPDGRWDVDLVHFPSGAGGGVHLLRLRARHDWLPLLECETTLQGDGKMAFDRGGHYLEAAPDGRVEVRDAGRADGAYEVAPLNLGVPSFLALPYRLVRGLWSLAAVPGHSSASRAVQPSISSIRRSTQASTKTGSSAAASSSRTSTVSGRAFLM